MMVQSLQVNMTHYEVNPKVVQQHVTKVLTLESVQNLHAHQYEFVRCKYLAMQKQKEEELEKVHNKAVQEGIQKAKKCLAEEMGCDDSELEFLDLTGLNKISLDCDSLTPPVKKFKDESTTSDKSSTSGLLAICGNGGAHSSSWQTSDIKQEFHENTSSDTVIENTDGNIEKSSNKSLSERAQEIVGNKDLLSEVLKLAKVQTKLTVNIADIKMEEGDVTPGMCTPKSG